MGPLEGDLGYNGLVGDVFDGNRVFAEEGGKIMDTVDGYDLHDGNIVYDCDDM